MKDFRYSLGGSGTVARKDVHPNGRQKTRIGELLACNADVILVKAVEKAERAHLKHYEESGAAVLRQRLKALLDLTVQAVKERNATQMVRHAEKIARERFVSGYDLSEVQTAFNVLEETMWRLILREMEPRDYAEALGLVSSALGTGKDALARAYVSLASRTRAPHLDLRWTFEGTDAFVEPW